MAALLTFTILALAFSLFYGLATAAEWVRNAFRNHYRVATTHDRAVYGDRIWK